MPDSDHLTQQQLSYTLNAIHHGCQGDLHASIIINPHIAL